MARPGEGCGPEVAALIRAENADRRIIYDAFMKENNIPAPTSRACTAPSRRPARSAVAPNDWVQLDDGQWVRKQ